MKIIPYLLFDGQASAAMRTYLTVLGAEAILVSRYGDNPDFPVAEEHKNRIMHARIQLGNDLIFLSDVMPGQDIQFGNSTSLNIEFDSREAIETAFEILAEGGEVEMELQDTFWGAYYGKLTDRFGTRWDLNFQYQEEE